MLARIGKIKYLKHNPNDFNWDLSGISGAYFENSIHFLILKELKKYSDICKAIKTPDSGDRGKDVIISFKDKFKLFGIVFYPPPKKKYCRLHVEIKKKNKGALSANEFGGSLLQHDADGIKPDYFLLVTSAYLSPNTAFHAEQEFSKEGIQFFVIDKHRLAEIVLKHNFKKLNLFNELPPIDPVNVSYCLQSEDQINEVWDNSSKNSKSQKVFFLYLKIQNYDSTEHVVSIDLRSDINWGLSPIFKDELNVSDQKSIRLFIPPFVSKCKKLKLEQISFDAIDELRIAITIDSSHHTVNLSGNNLNFDFDPPLFGKEHNALRGKLIRSFQNRTPVKLIDLHGFAGTGKSKLLQEVVRLLTGTDKYFISYEIRKEKENIILASILKKIATKENLNLNISTSISLTVFKDKLISISKSIEFHHVLIFEDLHHASRELLMFLKKIASDLIAGISELRNISIIATGRNDNTFSNEFYYSFIDHIGQLLENYNFNYEPRILQARLQSWSNKDCIRFIKSTVIDIPDFVAKKIMKLSENTPFGTIQSIQYLLDLNIVEIVNRNTIGVINAEVLSRKNFLPSGIKELLDLRIQNIAKKYGEKIFPLLSSLAYLGMENSYAIVLQLMGNDFDNNLLTDLTQKKILAETEQGIKFGHENLQIYFISFLENEGLGKECAENLLKGTGTSFNLSIHQKGYLFYRSKNYSKAFNCFKDIWSKVSTLSVNNISSVDIPENYFTYFEPLINTAIKLKQNYKLIQNLGTIEVYTALHNKPLVKALEICERNLKLVKKLDKHKFSSSSNIIKIEQLKAHILLNMGFIRPAQKIMLEISTKAKLDKKIENDKALMFDVYDRLQNIYHQLNHLKQFKQYSNLSYRVAKQMEDNKMLSLVESSRVKEFYYNNPSKFYDQTKFATQNAFKNASKRHICHAELNLCVAELIRFCKDPEKIKITIKNLHKNLSCATENGYSFSITRAQLGIGVAYSLLGLKNPENLKNAERFSNFGLESALRYGNGFFYWQLHNLKAIIEINRTISNTQLVAGHFETALHFLNKQGLLFLGSLDSLSPNLSVISNVIHFYDTYLGDKVTHNFVKKLNFYDKGMNNEKEEIILLIKNLRKYKLIGRKKELPKPFIEPSSGYLLAVR